MTRANDDFAKLVLVIASAALVAGLLLLSTTAFAEDETTGTNAWESLQSAINSANEGDVIPLEGDVVDTANKGSIKIKKKVTIDLNGFKIDRHLSNEAADDGHVIHVLNGGELTIIDSTAHGGEGQGAITGGFAGAGGGVTVDKGGTLNVISGTIGGNRSQLGGGGVYVEGTLNMTGGAISGNSASVLVAGSSSGGVYFGEGGGVLVGSGGTISLSNAIVANNDASKNGGGICLGKAESATIDNCEIAGNTSAERGGGLYMDAEGKRLQITATKIEENFASEGGGGIYLFQGAISMSGGTLSKNTAAGYGGGADITSKTTFIANDVAIDGNAANVKGGGGVANFGTTELEGCVITNNSAAEHGGGVLGDTDGGGTGDLTLKSCTITGNRAVEDGGGVYNGKNLKVIGGKVSKNNSENMGGGIHIGKNAETTYVEGSLVVQSNTAGVFGNDLMVRSGHKLSTGRLTEGETSIGVDLESGTGTLTKDYGENNGSVEPKSLFSASWGFGLELKNGEVEIKSDWSSIKSEIEDADNGAVVPLSKDYAAGSSDERIIIAEGKTVTVDLNGYTLNRNLSKKKEHGQVFEVRGTLVLKDGSATQRGAVTGGWADCGGGITVRENGKLVLEGGAITRNRASDNGGGVYVRGSFDVRGGAIEGNEAEGSGGGVYLEEKGVLSLEDGKIAENAADGNGGGISVASEDAIVYAKGSPVVRNNSAKEAGNDVFLPGYLTVTGAFDDGAKIGIALECGTGMFTFDYPKYNEAKDPAQFFVSTEGYVVGMGAIEVWLKKDTFGETDYEKPLIEWNDQIKTDPDALCSQNWMSGISGERYLNEINMPGAHDAGMHWIETFSGVDVTAWISAFAYSTGAKYATTQTSHIDQILAMGARQLDIRLNDCYKKRFRIDGENIYDWADDGENLWLCHGQSSFGGTYFAEVYGKRLSLDTVLDWTKEFLEEHPTETVILNLRPETFRDGHEDPIMKRTRKILERKVLDVNPSTGEPFLYKEPGSDDYFAAYKHIPQLKDCRGKIVLLPNRGKYVEQVGGYLVNTLVEHYEAPTDYKLTSSEKVQEVPRAYAALSGGTVALPTAAGGQTQNYLWYWELNCTGEDQGIVEQYVLSGPNPVENAKVVNPALVGTQNVFGSHLGKYIGWVRMDGFESKYAEPIWRTNFFDELEYCTITVKSNLDDPNYPDQTYRLLKGTQITVPDNIYKQLPQGKNLDHWTTKGASQVSETNYNPGATLSVTEDITFTAQWMKPGYSVKFDANVPAGASTTCAGSMEDQRITYDDKTALNANGYTLPGYDFAGWNTKVDGSGTAFADEAEVENLADADGTVTLYAQWNAKAYEIVFNPGDIGGNEHRQTAYFDQPSMLEAYSDASFGWNSGSRTLHGWAGTGFGSFYGDGAGFVNLCGDPRPDGSLANREFIAQWVQEGQIIVTVTRDGVPQGGLADELSLVDGSGTKFSVPISYGEGRYVFDPSQAEQPGSMPARLPSGAYNLSFEANGYPKATASITYGEDSATSVVFAYHTVSLAKDPDHPDFNEVSISGGEPVAGETNAVIALDGSSLGITATVDSNYLFDGYTATGVPPAWEDGDPTKAVQTVVVQGAAAITAHISPKPRLTITPVPQSLAYNGQTQGPGDVAYDDPAEIAEAVTVDSLREGDTLSSVVLDGQGKDVGDYDLVAGNAVVANAAGDNVTDDYIIDYVPGTLSIEPAKVAITVKSASKVQGEADPAFTGTVEGLVAEGDLGEVTYIRTNDEEAPGIYSGVLDAEYTANQNYEVVVSKGDFTIEPLPAQKGVLTFDLGGGTIDGKTSLTIEADVGDVITIPKAPVRDGYTFKYWKGSEYYPGDKYTVKGDHAFTAVWEENAGGNGSNNGGSVTKATGTSGTSTKGSPSSTGDALGGSVVGLVITGVCALCLAVIAMLYRRRSSGHTKKHDMQ